MDRRLRGPHLAGYASSGDTSTAFSELSRDGLMDSAKGEVSITEAGRKRLGPVDQLPTGKSLREQTLSSLDRCDGSLLRVMFETFPRPMTKGEVLNRAGYKSSGDTSTAFARLNRRGFMVSNGRGVTAASEFFE